MPLSLPKLESSAKETKCRETLLNVKHFMKKEIEGQNKCTDILKHSHLKYEMIGDAINVTLRTIKRMSGEHDAKLTSRGRPRKASKMPKRLTLKLRS